MNCVRILSGRKVAFDFEGAERASCIVFEERERGKIKEGFIGFGSDLTGFINGVW